MVPPARRDRANIINTKNLQGNWTKARAGIISQTHSEYLVVIYTEHINMKTTNHSTDQPFSHFFLLQFCLPIINHIPNIPNSTCIFPILKLMPSTRPAAEPANPQGEFQSWSINTKWFRTSAAPPIILSTCVYFISTIAGSQKNADSPSPNSTMYPDFICLRNTYPS